MRVHVRQAFEAISPDRADVTVLFDIFRASTTLSALISKAPAQILATNDQAHVAALVSQGYVLVSEVFAGGLDNSPSQVLAEPLTGKHVVHKSTNLTTALFHIFPHTHRVIVGSFVNMTKIVTYLQSIDPGVVDLVPAGHFEKKRNAVEDTACAMMMAARLRGRAATEIPDMPAIQTYLAGKRQERPGPSHYWNDVEIALTLDRLPYIAEAKVRGDGTFEMVPLQ